jgi:hypothetical protein
LLSMLYCYLTTLLAAAAFCHTGDLRYGCAF